MYLKVNNIKVPIKIKTEFSDRLKAFRFKFDEVEYALCFPDKRKINTYFYCLKFDIIMTDKDNVILNIFPSTATEARFKGKRKVFYTYIFPCGIADYYGVGDKLDVVLTKKDKELLEK